MKFLVCCMLFLTTGFTASSQSIYHFEYSFPNTNDNTVYQAFFVRSDNGSGFVRIRFQSTGIEQTQLVEMDMHEQYFADTAGAIDTSKLFYQATTPRSVIGSIPLKFPIPVFWYTKDPPNEFFEPVAVSILEDTAAKYRGKMLKAAFVQSADLKKDFVSQFFTPDEDFYQNLFGIKARGLTAGEKNTNIYLLVVANSNDSSIGSSCYKDMTRMVHTFQDLAEYLDIKIYPTTIFGKTYTLKNIENAIAALHPSANDIVIFYYSGHGFRKEQTANRKPIPYQKSRYPFLDFRAKPDDDYNFYSMNLEDIYKKLDKKNARLTLVLSDCCNNVPGSTNSEGTPIPPPRGSGLDWNEDNLRALFLNPKHTSLMATAADIGQRASSNNAFGGFFSYFFKTSMEDCFTNFKKNVTWDMVMKDAQDQTSYKAQHTYCSKPYIPANICRQNPFYDKVITSQ